MLRCYRNQHAVVNIISVGATFSKRFSHELLQRLTGCVVITAALSVRVSSAESCGSAMVYGEAQRSLCVGVVIKRGSASMYRRQLALEKPAMCVCVPVTVRSLDFPVSQFGAVRHFGLTAF